MHCIKKSRKKPPFSKFLPLLLLLLFLPIASSEEQNCSVILADLPNSPSKCAFVRQTQCVSQGYIDYLEIFYCNFDGDGDGGGGLKILGFFLLALWLALLFYLLGDTANHFFCPSLECLAGVLDLSPTVAGVTLLSLGNGAPDVFSSIVAFAGTGAGDVGLSSVLGGALFVTTVVVGLVSIFADRGNVGDSGVPVDGFCFLRDALFLLTAVAAVLGMVTAGRIFLWEAICFSSLYIVYVAFVSAPHCLRRAEENIDLGLVRTAITDIDIQLPLIVEEAKRDREKQSCRCRRRRRRSSGGSPESFPINPHNSQTTLPPPQKINDPDHRRRSLVEAAFAVTSSTLSPILLSAVYAGKDHSFKILAAGGFVGAALGIVSFKTTHFSNPPENTTAVLAWVTGGFVMSMTWSYLLADELVGLLVSLGTILSINPSLLGLTVLAWGNSVGDLATNLAITFSGGAVGAQIAVSGCYAGPLFNTLVGLGVSLVFAAWRVHPAPFVVPAGGSPGEIVGFLVGGLVWAAGVMLWRKMRLGKVMGVGLVGIYVSFLGLRISQWFGLFN